MISAGSFVICFLWFWGIQIDPFLDAHELRRLEILGQGVEDQFAFHLRIAHERFEMDGLVTEALRAKHPTLCRFGIPQAPLGDADLLRVEFAFADGLVTALQEGEDNGPGNVRIIIPPPVLGWYAPQRAPFS